MPDNLITDVGSLDGVIAYHPFLRNHLHRKVAVHYDECGEFDWHDSRVFDCRCAS